MAVKDLRVEPLEDLQQAYDGSYYTICGVDFADIDGWVEGITQLWERQGVGTPSVFYTSNGAALNLFGTERKGGPLCDQDRFKSDLGILMIPLNGLNGGRLAILKIQMGDRWFDDIIDNMRREKEFLA